jgi:hypothetical protein
MSTQLILRFSIAAFFTTAALTLFSQTVEVKKSVHIEYGYTGLTDQPEYMQRLYGAQRFEVYADNTCYMITSRQQQNGQEAFAVNTIVSTYVTEYATQKTWLCISLDTLKIKMEIVAGKDEGSNLKEVLFGADTPLITSSQKTDNTETVSNYACNEVVLEYQDRTPINILYAPQFVPSGNMTKSPFFLNHNGQTYGLVMGHNQELGPMKLHLRALKVAIDTPDPAMNKMLDNYRQVTHDQGNQLIREMLIKK